MILPALKISYQNLVAHKLRSFLTILGIIIGVAAVVIIFSLGKSAQDLVLDQIKGVGSDLLAVLPGASNEDGPPAAAFGITVTTLNYDDLEELRDGKSVPEVTAGAGYVQGSATVEYGREDRNATFVGTTASYMEVENAGLAEGRFFIEDEETNLSKVTVLGSEIARELFDDEDPVNQKIKIKDQNFQIIGVFEERGSTAFGVSSQDDSIYVPLRTAQKLLLGIDHLAFIRLKASGPDLIESAKANIQLTLRNRHDIDDPADDDFSVRDLASALEIITKVTDSLRYFLLAIGVISLIVGGVGIMNIMLIAVSQRIREIGVRRAVGARRGDVLIQFLIESGTVALIGGILGIILGIVVSFLASLIIIKLGWEWQFYISPISILAATLVSIAIGLLFGIYPAQKAAKTSPMEALRYE